MHLGLLIPGWEEAVSRWEYSDKIRLRHYFPDRSNDPEELPQEFGFGWRHTFISGITHPTLPRRLPPRNAYEGSFPVWFIVLLTTILPLWRVISSARRHRRIKTSLCSECGYSLTGNTSGVCPECGTPIPKEPAGQSPRPA